ncbi:MAG TPA: hypothetical protein VK556_09850 [Candidatus Udaeobacter sp.]|jgi:hypothetical protein|nr:hypothetical protein [Candidatus Udaeobacter sp.]
MDTIKSFASQKIKPYGTDVSDGVETNWTIRAAVSAFVVIALASFCLPGLPTLHSSTAGAQQHREQFNHKKKINLCVLAKTPAKVCIRKGGAQQPVKLFYYAGDISLRRINFPACSLCPPGIHSGIARGSLMLRERAPPV